MRTVRFRLARHRSKSSGLGWLPQLAHVEIPIPRSVGCIAGVGLPARAQLGWMAGGPSQRATPLTDSRCSSVVSSFTLAHSDDGALRSARSRASRRSTRACSGGRDPRRESDSSQLSGTLICDYTMMRKQGTLYLLGFRHKAPDMMVCSPTGERQGVRHEGPKRARVERGSASTGSVRVWS
ncbi:hypothetical protein Hhis01_03877 [Haloarcula hispanica]